MQVFTPVAWATAAAAGMQHPRVTPGDGLTVDCGAIWDTCRDGCQAAFVGNAAACGLVAAGCLVACGFACSGTLLGWPICFAICSAGCLALEAGCLSVALGAVNQCRAVCDANRMACEPGWAPPVAE